MLLVLSDQFDVHGDIVESKLRQKDVDLFRLNLDVNSLQQISINFDGKEWYIESPNGALSSGQISCIWQRRAFVETSIEESLNKDIDFQIWKGEWDKTLLGLYSSILHFPWLNPFRENARAENKFYQMRLAEKVGLKLPATISSNKREILIEFSKRHIAVVAKLLNQDLYKTNDGEIKGIYVNKIPLSELELFGDLSENPLLLQEYIPKAYEVRYTVVGENHYVCKIDSQLSHVANVDWRRYDLPNTPHYSIYPPDTIKDKVNSLMRHLGLYFGALDFIVSPEGEWYFLEINPSGQWLWIEDLTGLAISDAIAYWLQQKSSKEIL